MLRRNDHPTVGPPPIAQEVIARRAFLERTGVGVGVMALAALLAPGLRKAQAARRSALGAPHIPPRAKRVIQLFMSGGPSQIELFDPKPNLNLWTGTELPESVRRGQRLTGMTSGQKSFPLVGSRFPFHPRGRSGIELSELLPGLAQIVDEIALVRSVWTEPINHNPAVNMFNTGHAQPGRPNLGSWLSYGLGTENEDLPAYVVLISGGKAGQPLGASYWHQGFLPGQHQGVPFRSRGDAVLYLSDPPGIDRNRRRRLLDGIQSINRARAGRLHDPEIEARIEAFEMAYRMQASVPDLMDLSDEPQSALDMYGAKPGAESFANNCLLARRLSERGVRFVQLFHRDWDHHGDLPNQIRAQCEQTDQASAALIGDLKQRGLLDETVVIWGGEFGRTAYSQGAISAAGFGRDHHPRCFATWLAGGGIRGGITLGRTDDFSYNVDEDPVHVHDLQATVLACLGIDHEELTFRSQGREFRLTDVGGKVVDRLLA